MALNPKIKYIGNNSYISLICCIDDLEKEKKTIEEIVSEGFRVWFDDTDSDEPENMILMRKKIDCCELCMAIVSEQSINSHFFRSNLTYAISSGKKVVFVLTDDIVLPLGIYLQATFSCKIEKFNLSEEEFLETFYNIDFVQNCIGKKQSSKWIERFATGKKIKIKPGINIIGKSKEQCDIVIDNVYMSRQHATIIDAGDICSIIDNNSKNKTYVNSTELVSGEKVILTDGDAIIMANEKFVFHQN